jgi:hypothetical protein
MTLREKEKELFDEWRKKRPKFIPDGVIDEKGYLKSPLKVLYILKEVNGGENWDLRDYMKGGGRSATMSNIARWQYAIENFEEDISFSKINNISQSFRQAIFKNIAVLNIKKEPVGASAKSKEIWTYSWDDREFIRKQVTLYNPDIVICCGTGEMVKERELITSFKKWSISKLGVEYYKNGKLILNFVHPQQRKITKKDLFIKLLETLRELKN